MRGARLFLACLAACTTAGCAVDPRGAPSIERDLSRPPATEPPFIPMAPVALSTHADFDAFEAAQLGRFRQATVVAIYDELAKGADPAAREEDARLLMRLARLAFRSSEGGMQRAFAHADRLRAEAPNRPDTLYLMAELKQMLLLAGSSDRTFVVTERSRDIAERLRVDLRQLLERAPSYVGPEGIDARQIREDLAALEAALAPPPEAPAALAAPPSSGLARPLGPEPRDARAALWQFEAASPIARQKLCEAPPPAGNTYSWALALECALDRGDLDLAVRATGGRPPASVSEEEQCAWARRLHRRFPGSEARLGLPGSCPADARAP